ncbi:hypothetical protein M0R45_036024 [Rubus argutus]|uniref:Uncharacterized protein n=1 Tax=Rubus argutus TaxID=59490 RepID=A0AAW1VVV8_RUBAR
MRLDSEHELGSGDTVEGHSGKNWYRAVVIAEDGNAGWNGKSVTAGQRSKSVGATARRRCAEVESGWAIGSSVVAVWWQ